MRGASIFTDEFIPAVLMHSRRKSKSRTGAGRLQKIIEKFATPDPEVSKLAPDFEKIQDQVERAIRMRDAYERVGHLLRTLEMT